MRSCYSTDFQNTNKKKVGISGQEATTLAQYDAMKEQIRKYIDNQIENDKLEDSTMN